MAQLKGGTTIGGYLAYHSGNINTSNEFVSKTTIGSNSFIDNDLIFSYADSSNVDHIHYDDTTNRYYFNADTTKGATSGNANIQAAIFYGALSGNATTATSAGTCTGNAASSTLIYVNDYNSTTGMRVLGSHNGISSNGNVYSTSGIYMRMDTNTIYATTFSGALSGNATSATLASTVTVTNSTSSTFYPLVWHNNSNALYDTATTMNVQASTGTLQVSGGIIPTTDNTGVVGNSTYTWSNGQFTSLTIDSTLSVRGAIDLADNDILRLGSSDDWEFFHDGSNNYIDLNVGDLYIRDNTTARFRLLRTTGQLDVQGDLVAYSASVSDERLKENINTLSSSLDKILKLRGVNFEWKEGYKDGTHVGYIAQEIEEIIPEVVIERSLMKYNDETYKIVRYEEVIPYLSEAIKEQQKIINELKEDLYILKKQIK